MNNTLLLFLLLVFTTQQTLCFNIFSTVFDGLRYGKLDGLKEKFNFEQPKCVQGSYFYNGSCYFISNHRSNVNLASSSLLFSKLINSQESRSLLPPSLQSTIIGTAALSAVLPNNANWLNSSSFCQQLNNESSMITFENYAEYEFLINLLFKLKFNNNETDYMKEEAFFIGLRYNRTTLSWTWLNDVNLTQSFFMPNATLSQHQPLLAQLPILNKRHSDYVYRPCAYLYLRGNGDINIDNDNCDRDHKPYICKYVLDRCYNNTKCGQNGECVNLPFKKTFECRCRILYDGKFCHKWSAQGIQMICSVGLVVGAFVATILTKIVHSLYTKYVNRKKLQRLRELKQPQENDEPLIAKRVYSLEYFSVNNCELILKYMKKNLKFFIVLVISLALACFLLFMVTFARYKLIESKYEKLKAFNTMFKDYNGTTTNSNTTDALADKLTKILADSKWSADICKLVQGQFIEDYLFVLISLPLTIFIYVYNSFWCNRNHSYLCKIGKIKVKRGGNNIPESGVKMRRNIYENDSVDGSNSVFGSNRVHDVQLPEKVVGGRVTLWTKFKRYLTKLKENRKDESKRIALCCCTCRFDLISPMNPFGKKNRFITAVIYAAYTYNILKIFEHLLLGEDMYDASESVSDKVDKFKNTVTNMSPTDVSRIISNFGSTIERGILTDLLKQIFNVLIIGLRYYPILLCVEMKHKRALCYFLCSLYMWLLFIFHLYTNTFCLFVDTNDASILDLQNSTNSRNLTSFLSQFYGDHKRNFTLFGPRRMDHHTLTDLGGNGTASNATNETMNEIVLTDLLRFKREPQPFAKLHNLINETQHRFKSNNNSTPLNISASDAEYENEFLKQKRMIFLNNILYEKLIFYIVLCIITIHLTVETIDLIRMKVNNLIIYCKKRRIQSETKATTQLRVSSLLFNDDYNREMIEELMMNEKTQEAAVAPLKLKLQNDNDDEYMSAEMLYTKKLFQRKLKAKSFIKYLVEKYIYRFKMHFKYSKQIINTYIIAFILLYYLTCILIRKSKLLIDIMNELLVLFINFIFRFSSRNITSQLNMIDNEAIELAASTTRQHLNLLVNYLFSNIGNNITIACVLTTLLYVVQLLLGIRSYQKHILNAYKGVYSDIPSPKRFTNTKKASSSLHYSGYMIGYLLWGYVILFQVFMVILLVFKLLLKFYFIIEKLLKLILPILVIFLFKRIFIWYITRYFLIKHKNRRFFLLKNSKLYAILTHFNFFFDCFLGSFVCFMRMAQSSLAALFFMPRLDYSVFGRMLERSDMGFISYVNFIHLEVNQSHPIKIAFCELLVDLVKQKHKRGGGGGGAEPSVARNRWFLAMTLMRVHGLYKQRKKYLQKHNRIPKAESFEQFLERKVRLKSSIGSLGKMSKTSKSTASLYTVDENRIDSLTTNSSNATLDSTFIKRKYKKAAAAKQQQFKVQRQRKVSQDSLDL